MEMGDFPHISQFFCYFYYTKLIWVSISRFFPDLEYVNFGSGFGARYFKGDTDLNVNNIIHYYIRVLEKISEEKNRKIELCIEPGRYLLANSGRLVTKVLNVKKINEEIFEIAVDAGFGELTRPKLYKARVEIENFNQNGSLERKKYNIRGNTALQNDFLGKDIIQQ